MNTSADKPAVGGAEAAAHTDPLYAQQGMSHIDFVFRALTDNSSSCNITPKRWGGRRSQRRHVAQAPFHGTGECQPPMVFGISNYAVFEQVKGYAKLTAGTLTGNQREKDLGQAKLDGELDK
jgi:hypothetical protein